MMIQIDPDDIDLKNAIYLAETRKKEFEQADRDWDREEQSMYLYTQQHDKMVKARDKYDGALMYIGRLILERL